MDRVRVRVRVKVRARARARVRIRARVRVRVKVGYGTQISLDAIATWPHESRETEPRGRQEKGTYTTSR